jgi:hypothetical protein
MGAIDRETCSCEKRDNEKGIHNGYCKHCQKRAVNQNIIILIGITVVFNTALIFAIRELNTEKCTYDNYGQIYTFRKCQDEVLHRFLLYIAFFAAEFIAFAVWGSTLVYKTHNDCNIQQAYSKDTTQKLPECHYCYNQINYRFFKRVLGLFGALPAIDFLKKKYNH